MSKLMELPDVKISTSRSGFDMSQKVLFSAKAGELLPVFCQEMIPSNKKRISLQSFARTRPVNTAAYTRLREYYDFYFVPYTQLWKQWKMFALQMEDNSIYASSITEHQSISEMHPYFTVKQVADYIGTQSQSRTYNILGFDRSALTVKLLQYLGYGDFSEFRKHSYDDSDSYSDNASMYNVPLNPFPLLAYQKIYQDKYRNTQWEKSAPWTYNLDYITGSGDCQIPVQSIGLSANSPTMFDLQYVNWNKDYYMGLLPSSQYGDEAVVPIGIDSNGRNLSIGSLYGGDGTDSGDSASASLGYSDPVSVYLKGIGLPSNKAVVSQTSASKRVDGVYSTPDQLSNLGDYISDLSILLLRQYEMLQRYNEVRQSAPTDYKSQIEKLFGVSLSWRDSNEVRWLGGVARNFDIGEVVNTNLDSSDSRASIYGKGVSVSDGHVEFDSQGEYGILMCVYHVMPILDYQLGGPLKLNTKYKFSDYAQPAFDRIGMQEVTAADLFNSPAIAKQFKKYGYSADRFLSTVLGYGPRYLDYKTQVDRIVGVFTTTEKQWATPFSDEFMLNYIFNPVFGGETGVPVPPSNAVASTDLFNYVTFKVNPSILDPIFAVNADDVADSEFDTDQFLCNAYFDVKDVKNLDYDGMPY